jgi:hypothetical protein
MDSHGRKFVPAFAPPPPPPVEADVNSDKRRAAGGQRVAGDFEEGFVTREVWQNKKTGAVHSGRRH